MSRRVWTVLAVVALAVVTAGAAAPAYAAGGAAAVVAQAPTGGSTGVAEEAPSSISTGDQVRAFAVLGVCVVAIGLPVLLVVLKNRRRQRALRPDLGSP